MVDERRFLVSNATLHLKAVPKENASGETRVIVQDGKLLIDVPVCHDRIHLANRSLYSLQLIFTARDMETMEGV